jgi:pimeloyl-ACP methyl ester carboxylesterase
MRGSVRVRREEATIGECRIDVSRYGAGSPLVVLHGEYGVTFADEFLESLGAQHEVFVPHHPGWAGSSRPTHVETVRDIALVQQEFLEEFGQPVPVIGLSFGGWVAAEVAATCPGLVASLVLVSPTGIKVGDREERDFVDIYVTASDQRRSLLSATTGPPMDGDLAFEITKAEEAVARYCWSPYMHDPGLRHRLRRITAPTIVVSGSEDRFVLRADYFETYARLVGRGAAHRKIDGAGHSVEEEAPKAVVDVVHEFIGQEMPTTAGR